MVSSQTSKNAMFEGVWWCFSFRSSCISVQFNNGWRKVFPTLISDMNHLQTRFTKHTLCDAVTDYSDLWCEFYWKNSFGTIHITCKANANNRLSDIGMGLKGRTSLSCASLWVYKSETKSRPFKRRLQLFSFLVFTATDAGPFNIQFSSKGNWPQN